MDPKSVILGNAKSLLSFTVLVSTLANAAPILNEVVANFDRDSLTDLMEYALGTDPFTPNSAPLQVTWNAEGDLILNFPHNLLAPDIEILIENSSDQIAWNSYHKDLSFLSSLAADDSHIATDRYQNFGQLAQNHPFFRLRVKQVEPTDGE